MAEDLTDTERCTLERNQKEYNGLVTGIANVILSWATVENELVKLLTAVLNRDNMKLPAAMYFSLTGLESRMRMVDSAVRELLAGHKHEKRIECAWKGIYKRLKECREVRNNVAHGQIVHVARSPMAIPRLTSPILDISKHRKRKEGQLPGHSANDLHQSSAGVDRVARKVDAFEALVRLMHAGDEASLLNKLAELEGKGPRPDTGSAAR